MTAARRPTEQALRAIGTLRQLGHLVTIEQVGDEALVPIRHVLFQSLFAQVAQLFADVLHWNHSVDAVGLAADVLVDPGQLFLELLGTVGDRAEHTEATRATHRSHNVTAVTKGEYRKL